MTEKKTKFKSLGTRLAVAAVGISVCLAVLLCLPLWATAVLETIAAFFMAYEFSHNTGLIKNKAVCAVSIIQAMTMPWLLYSDMSLTAITAFVFAFVFIQFSVMISVKAHVSELLAAFFSSCIFPLFISLLVPILRLENGRLLVLIPFIVAWCADAMAYFIGSAFGKHPLAPSISPKKSVEGFFGGLAGGIIGMLVYGLILSLTKNSVPWLLFIAAGLIGSFFAQLGDLFLSYIKRECMIKDYGKLLPGHGGVLDRFDSVLFVIPVCYFVFEGCIK